jgi:hypothetical protein
LVNRDNRVAIARVLHRRDGAVRDPCSATGSSGSAELIDHGRPMIDALACLDGLTPGELPANMKAMGIGGVMGSLFSTHRPMEDRIRALQERAK